MSNKYGVKDNYTTCNSSYDEMVSMDSFCSWIVKHRAEIKSGLGGLKFMHSHGFLLIKMMIFVRYVSTPFNE